MTSCASPAVGGKRTDHKMQACVDLGIWWLRRRKLQQRLADGRCGAASFHKHPSIPLVAACMVQPLGVRTAAPIERLRVGAWVCVWPWMSGTPRELGSATLADNGIDETSTMCVAGFAPGNEPFRCATMQVAGKAIFAQ